ncbi:hypothetical protein GSI_02297 [Ganoderma sinense ZZ0214-1]|uniref:Uncharacterized protein n=1 Tax=Ganoderma sinense ZZ0214-1 TaxID=1077348 RepID=A0A2G8SP82_9APHY|nr:hypothetical protein GSI_02297 [Ganoderma sinense ZZ0214-1]
MNLVQTAPTVMDYGNSPGSEPSIYFDAPPAADSNSRFTEHLSAAAHSDHDLPGAFGDDHDEGAADVRRKPSVGAAYAHIVTQKPRPTTDDDEQEEARELGRNSSHRRAPSTAMTADSGYASNGNGRPRRSSSRASDVDASFAPIPILWTDAPHRRQASLIDSSTHHRSSRESPFRRAASLRSFRMVKGDRDDEGRSIKTAPSITGAATVGAVGLRRRRTSLVQGSFASGPGMVGPASTPVLDDAFRARSRSADLGLSERQRVKLSKAQIREGKKVAKIIRAEGKAEQKVIEEAVRELSDLQKLQKAAVKEESKAYAAYSKTLREFRKAELEFFAARAKYERAQADLQAQEDAREASRAHARETTEMLQEKNREVEWLRAQKAVDDREREAKVRELTGK